MKAFSRYCGIILMACFESTLYCHLLISVNRFCAIYFPLHNSKVLTPRVTTCLIIVALVIIFLQLLFYYILGGCAFVYVDDYWHFTLISTPTCINGVPWVSSLEKLLSLVFLVLAIDFITLSRVHIYNRQVFGSDPVENRCCTLLHRQDGVSDLGRENRGNDVSIRRKMAWGPVDVAIEEIGVEVVDDHLHGPSGRSDGSVRTSESDHLGLEDGEVPASIADAQPCLCCFSQHFRPSLLETFLYRLSA
ncbi:unnamed protein product [Heligmosomoides polygyrus]|uniref:7TM_GPCR_Srx domain-containing protein n=1 Tax=Heligmosomoides polygyrus TaxID=6339 RepID=A0A3P7X4Y5_HELPZ|nr:unnamed protein product [Heligmosomoides polygyrus]